MIRIAPISYTEPVRSPALFAGRSDIRSNLKQSLQSTLFIGEAQIGKTSLLLQLQHDLLHWDSTDQIVIPVYIDFNNPVFSGPLEIFAAIQHFLERKIGGLQADTPRRSLKTLENCANSILRFMNHLEVENRSYCTMLLLDNIDGGGLLRKGNLEVYSHLRSLIDNSPANNPIHIVATSTAAFLSRESHVVVSRLTDRLQTVYLTCLSAEECHDFLARTQIFRGAESNLPEVASHLFRLSGGHPRILQEVLYCGLNDCKETKNMMLRLKDCASMLAEQGSGCFRRLLRELSIEEIVYLQNLALGASARDCPIDEFRIRRLISAGLISRTNIQDSPRRSCELFFRWLQRSTSKLATASFARPADPSALADMIGRVLRAAVDSAKAPSEKRVQEAIQALLAAHEIPFEREKATVDYGGKRYIPDFSLSDLDLAIEAKVLRDGGKIGILIDEIVVDAQAYRSAYHNILFIIYDYSGRAQSHKFFQETSLSLEFIIVQH